MATLIDLVLSRWKLRKNIPDAKPGKITSKNLYPGSNTIAVITEFESSSNKEKTTYFTLIFFKEISVSEIRDSEHPIGFEMRSGKWLFTERPSKSKTRISVNCTCPDYYYAWWKWNSKAKALAGQNLPKYTRVTPPPPEGLPYKNPSQFPGLCKHIVLAADLLGDWVEP